MEVDQSGAKMVPSGEIFAQLHSRVEEMAIQLRKVSNPLMDDGASAVRASKHGRRSGDKSWGRVQKAIPPP